MRLCYPNPPFSQLAKVLTKIALKGAMSISLFPLADSPNIPPRIEVRCFGYMHYSSEVPDKPPSRPD